MSAVISTTHAMERLLLASPSAVAQALNWQISRAVVLSLHLGPSSIDVALFSHPASGNGQRGKMIQALPSIETSLVGPSALEKIADIVNQYKVCGLVVGGVQQKPPTEQTSDKKQTSLLYQMMQDTKIVTPSRPLCLWDDGSAVSDTDSDSETRVQQPENCETTYAAAIAADYLSTHWPALVQRTSAERQHPLADSGEIGEVEECLWSQSESDKADSGEEKPNRSRQQDAFGEIDWDTEQSLWTQPPPSTNQHADRHSPRASPSFGEIGEAEEGLWTGRDDDNNNITVESSLMERLAQVRLDQSKQ